MIYNKIWAWKSRNQDSYTKTAVMLFLEESERRNQKKGKKTRGKV